MNAEPKSNPKEESAAEAACENAMAKLWGKPWQPWFRNLASRVAKSYFSTVDCERLLQYAEELTQFQLTIEFSLCEKARILGHIAALRDYWTNLHRNAEKAPANLDPEDFDCDLPQFNFSKQEIHKIKLSEYIKPERWCEKLSFAEKAEFLNQYSHAYNRTVNEVGQLCGSTDASKIQLMLLIHTMTWPYFGRPKSVAELHRRMLGMRPKEKEILSPLQQQRKLDREEAELKRLQQICERLGLRLRGQPMRKARIKKAFRK